MQPPLHPALARLLRVAEQLGEMAERVVFIGGAVAPLLQRDPPFALARPTSDVDGVLATESYAALGRLHAVLTARGFRQRPGAQQHPHRWYSPDGIPLDLVPVGAHPGAAGSPWDRWAIATAVVTRVGHLDLRHVSGVGFLALKWAAYQDRGAHDPLMSHDLEDLLALLASDPDLAAATADAPAAVRAWLAERAAAFLATPFVEDLLAAHLNHAQDAPRTIAMVRGQLQVQALERVP